jgi:predicted metalloenzyme YecM
VRETLLTLGKELSAAIVNGRAIYIFELSTPVRVGNWDIPCVELPMPKVNHAYLDGWEHIEFVLPGTENKPIEVLFAETFPRILIEELKSRGVCSISTPQVSGEQLSNETLELKASNGVSLKFHRWGIKEVVGNTKG